MAQPKNQGVISLVIDRIWRAAYVGASSRQQKLVGNTQAADGSGIDLSARDENTPYFVVPKPGGGGAVSEGGTPICGYAQASTVRSIYGSTRDEYPVMSVVSQPVGGGAVGERNR